jgi:transcriptional regulator with XRE-family HTH domain
MNEVGLRIAELRSGKGQTLAAVAKAVGVTGAAVQQWESGSSKNIKLANLTRLAEHFGVSIKWLVSGEGPRQQEQAETSFESQALALFRQLGADGQHAALAHLNWMVATDSTPKQTSVSNPYPGLKAPAKSTS